MPQQGFDLNLDVGITPGKAGQRPVQQAAFRGDADTDPHQPAVAAVVRGDQLGALFGRRNDAPGHGQQVRRRPRRRHPA